MTYTCPTCGVGLPWHDVSFGSRLRALRLFKGMSQKAAAAMLGMPQTSLSAHEARAEHPSQRHVNALAAGYGVSPAVLLGMEEPPEELK